MVSRVIPWYPAGIKTRKMMMEQQNFGQEILKYAYESAKRRMDSHPEIADKYRKMVEEVPFYKDREEALKIACDMCKKGNWRYQVWAKVAKDEEYYYIEDYYIVSNDYKIIMAAEYIGMAQLFSN